LVTRAAVRPAAPVTTSDGPRLAFHEQRPTPDYSVFGTVRFERPYFTVSGQEGLCPLDAELSLPARCYSDRLREWTASGATDESYRESQTVIGRILGLSLSLQAIETAVVEAAATILVVQADAQGVPMVQPPTQRPSLRLAKGQKRTKQQDAVVTALYTLSPSHRTPQEVVAALLQQIGRPEGAARPRPVGKELQATLEGKTAAMSRLAQRVAQRDGPYIHQHVALTDGAEALHQ